MGRNGEEIVYVSSLSLNSKLVWLAKIKSPKLSRPLASTFQEDDLDKRNDKEPHG